MEFIKHIRRLRMKEIVSIKMNKLKTIKIKTINNAYE